MDNPEDISFFQLIFQLIDSRKIDITLKNTLSLIESNNELGNLCKKLYKPKATNALFNSVHIMKGYFQDIEYLINAFNMTEDNHKKKKYLAQAKNIAKILSK